MPGMIFFIFLPSCLFSYFEEWSYTDSIYYSFVTLTTIGFGDKVATFQEHQVRGYFVFFEVLSLNHFSRLYIAGTRVWRIVHVLSDIYNILVHFGPRLFGHDFRIYCQVSGYIFVYQMQNGSSYSIVFYSRDCRGMRSKRLTRLEHQLSENIKATQQRIWQGVTKDVGYLRRILNEVYLMKFKVSYFPAFPYNFNYIYDFIILLFSPSTPTKWKKFRHMLYPGQPRVPTSQCTCKCHRDPCANVPTPRPAIGCW